MLLPYHLRLAVRGIQRARGLSAAMFVGTALATSIWTTIFCHYLRYYGPRQALDAGLHQVELRHTSTLATAFGGSNAEPSGWASRTRVSFPEYEVLSGSGIPSRETAAVRERVLVAPGAGAGDGAAAPAMAVARLVSAAFFPMFRIPIGAGRPFTADEERGGRAVAVLGETLAHKMFGGHAVGKTLIVEGEPFDVVGTVAGDQPIRPDWDPAMTGGDQDAIYIPFSWFRRLPGQPEVVVHQSPAGWRFADLLRSDAVYVVHWLELPTDDARAAYARYLDERLGRRGIQYQLRSWAEWQAAFPLPNSPIFFFTLIGAMVMVASGFNTARLLLAKGMAYRENLAIHRALGATRGSLFFRQVVEALVVSLAGGAVGVLLALPYTALFNNLVADSDIPVRMTGSAVAAGVLGALLTGAFAALYPAWRLCITPPTVHAGRA